MKHFKRLLTMSVLTAASVANAGVGPDKFSYEGRLYDATTNAPSNHTVNLTLQVLHPTAVTTGVYCILREEKISGLNLALTDGYFSVAVGQGALQPNDPGLAMRDVFLNKSGLNGKRTDDGTSCPVPSTGGMARNLRVIVEDVTASTTATLAPDVGIGTTPYAMAADSLQGFTPADLLQVNPSVPALTQPNLENLFSATNYAKLQSLLAGTSSQYISSTSTQGSKVYAGSVSSPVAGSVWVDGNDLKFHNGSTTVTLGAGGGGSVTSVTAGAGLSGGVITGAGTISLSATGVTSGTYGSSSFIPWFTVDTYGRVTAAGSNSFVVDASMISTGTLSTTVLPIVPVSKGGTNSPTPLNSNRMVVTSGGAIIEAPALLNGQVFVGQTGGAPVPANLTAGAGISITNGAGTISISATASTLTAGAVGSTEIANGSIQSVDIATGGIAAANLDTAAVTTSKIMDDNVTFAKIQNISTQRLVGRSTSGFGDMEEISIGANLSLANGTLSATGGGGGLSLSGGSMTGALQLWAAPSSPMEATTKSYVDTSVQQKLNLTGGSLSGALTASGQIHSTSGGFRFPDGTVMTTAAGTGGSTTTIAGLTGGTLSSGYFATSNPGYGFYHHGTSNVITSINSATGYSRIGTESADNLALITGNVNRMWITPTGLVGIGTTGPTSILDVRGGAITAGSQSNALGGEIRFAEAGANGLNRVAFRAPDSIASDVLWVLPAVDGGSGQVLSTNGAGTLSWTTIGGGGDFFRSGSASMTGPLLSAGGSSLSPGLAFSYDTDTGLYSAGANTLGFVVGGQQRFVAGANGLEVAGHVKLGGQTSGPGRYPTISLDGRAGQDGGHLWTINGNAGGGDPWQAEHLRIGNELMGDVFAVGPNGETMIGYNTLYDLAQSKLDVAGNVAIGTYAGVSPAPTNGLAVSGFVGIGTTAPSTSLEVQGGAITAGSMSSSLGGEVRFREGGASGVQYVAFRAPSSIATNVTWTLPSIDGSNGQVLSTNGAGALSWQTVSGGTGASTVTLTGDVSGTGTGSIPVTISNLPYAKLQNVSTNNRLLGRWSAGTGSLQEIVIGPNLSLTGSTLSAVGGGSLGVASVGTAEIADGTIQSADLGVNAVGTSNISNGAVSFSKLQNISTGRLLGRFSGGSGDVEELIIGSGLVLSGGSLSSIGGGTGSSGITGLTGDVSASGTGVVTATISNLPFSKLQNVSTNNRLLGRWNAGTGAMEEVAVGSALSVTGGTLNFVGASLKEVGTNNLAAGSNSLASLGGGMSNSMFGSFSGQNLTSGNFNAGFGYNALKFNATGAYNTAVGASALMNTTGGSNTALGYMAGNSLTTGGSNIFLGVNAGANATTGSNNILIGNGTMLANGTVSNSINIGNTIFADSVSKRIGIGIQSPQAKVEVSESVSGSGTLATGFASYLDTTTGTSMTLKGVVSDVSANGGSTNVTNAFNYLATTTTTSGNTINNLYGFYMPAPTGTGTITNRYGIYVADAGARNIMGGSLAVGTMTSPTYTIDTIVSDSFSYSGASAIASSPSAGKGLAIRNVGNFNLAGAYLNLQVNNAGGTTQRAYMGAISQGTGSSPIIVIGAQTNTSGYGERMRIDQYGNVGIGTTTPSVTLDVNGPVKAANVQLTTGGGPGTPCSGFVSGTIGYHPGTYSIVTCDGTNWRLPASSTVSTTSGSSIDFSVDQTVVNSTAGSPLSFSGFQIGKEYRLVIQNSSGSTYTFNTGGGCTTWKFKPVNGNTTVSTDTIYKIFVAPGGTCYVDWATGY